jgi:hypothetical protein
MPHADPVVRRAYLKAWREKNKARTRDYVRRWQTENREHRVAYQREYYAARVQNDPEAVRAQHHREWLANRYRLTTAQFDALIEAQGNACAICGAHPPKGRRLHIDHDHETGAVRGLLCSRCNQGVGFFRDIPELLVRAAGYLRKAASAGATEGVADAAGD